LIYIRYNIVRLWPYVGSVCVCVRCTLRIETMLWNLLKVAREDFFPRNCINMHGATGGELYIVYFTLNLPLHILAQSPSLGGLHLCC